jgi:hypothetical protein
MRDEQVKTSPREWRSICALADSTTGISAAVMRLARRLLVSATWPPIFEVHQDPQYAPGCYPGGSNHRPEHVDAFLATGYQHSLASRYHLYLRVSFQ